VNFQDVIEFRQTIGELYQPTRADLACGFPLMRLPARYAGTFGPWEWVTGKASPVQMLDGSAAPDPTMLDVGWFRIEFDPCLS
jgi:hypothetical protein